jgi:peptidylprolyl isomerase
MRTAKPGDTVKVHYQGRLDDGTVFDSSRERGPLQFTIGSGALLPAFERAVAGLNPGQSRSIQVPAAEAYGHRRDDQVMEVDRRTIPPGAEPRPGGTVLVRRTDGQSFHVRVAAVTESHVTLDANHPLAGKDLFFDIELVEIL